MEGKKVLLVDTDPQGSLTISMGWQQPDELPTALSTLMQKAMNDQPIQPGEGILHHAEGVDLIPANIELAGLEVALVNSMNREKMLKQVLDSAKREYDFILLDCMPSLGMLTINALAAADAALIPVQAQYLSAKGLEQLLQTVQKVRRQINPKLKIEGILLTMTDNRTNYGKQISNLIRQAYGKHLKVFEQTIPRSVRAAEISAVGKSIFQHDPKTHFNKMNFVRYADDFIVTGESPEFLREEVLPIIRDFMTERGLQLSEEKTVITHIDDGFDFLGKNIRKYNGKLLIKPSKQSVGSLLKKVREIVKSNKSAKQDSLIRQLNPVIRGWVNNQRFVVSAETFSKIDYQIYNCLWQWAKRRHKNKGRRWIAAKYWHRIGTRNWTFAAEERTKKNGEQSYFALEYATDTKIIRFKKIVSNANPFDERWSGYYEERDGEKMLNSTNGREKLLKVWRNQHRCCPVCNEPITSETSFKVHKVFRSGKSPWLEMVHPECHAVLHKNDSCFVEPGSLTGAL